MRSILLSPPRSAEAKAAREEIFRCIASDDGSQAGRVGELVGALLAAPRPPFRAQLLGGGPWEVTWTSGAFLWQLYTSPGQLLTRSSNRASQEFDPAAQTALNFGEIAGPAVTVSAAGTYSPTDPKDNALPKEVDVEITGGEVRAWGGTVPLPIRGTGKFWIEYLDDAGIRVFRSTGGGLTMQVRQDVLRRLRGGERR
jgi:hypothetical protein